jgi:uncharacterized membrane protein
MSNYIAVDAALIGASVTILMQGIKALPKKWLVRVFGSSEKTQNLRMQVVVFLLVLVATILKGFRDQLFHLATIDDLIASGILSLMSAYTTYKGLVKTLSEEKMPTGTFKM